MNSAVANKENYTGMNFEKPAQTLVRFDPKRLEEDLNGLEERHNTIFGDVKRTNKIIDDDTFEQYLEFFSKWKELVKNKTDEYKAQIAQLSMELNEYKDYQQSLVNVRVKPPHLLLTLSH